MTHFDVFKFLVQHLCKRAAAGLWLDLFEGLLQRELRAVPGGSGGEAAADAKAVVVTGEELRQMFEWLTAVAFYQNRPTAEVIASETIDVATAVREDITHECVKMINDWDQRGESPTAFRDLLMRLWDDGYGNLLSRTIREVREEQSNG